MKTNKQIIIEKVLSEGYDIGIYDKFLDKLNKSNLKKVLDNIRYTSDTKVFIDRIPFIVEINKVDNEVDFNVLTLKEYEYRYGTWEDF